ncbi:uncharacterized protein LOC144262372 [Eretmochelys imbricata]
MPKLLLGRRCALPPPPPLYAITQEFVHLPRLWETQVQIPPLPYLKQGFKPRSPAPQEFKQASIGKRKRVLKKLKSLNYHQILTKSCNLMCGVYSLAEAARGPGPPVSGQGPQGRVGAAPGGGWPGRVSPGKLRPVPPGKRRLQLRFQPLPGDPQRAAAPARGASAPLPYLALRRLPGALSLGLGGCSPHQLPPAAAWTKIGRKPPGAGSERPQRAGASHGHQPLPGGRDTEQLLQPGAGDRRERRVIEMGKDKKYQGRVITRYILGSEGQEQASGQPVTVHDPLPAHWKESMEPGDQVGINIISSLQDCIASAEWHASSIEQGSKLRKTFKHLFPKGTMTSRSIGKSIKLAFPNQMLILNPHKLLKTPTHTREKMYFKLKSL